MSIYPVPRYQECKGEREIIPIFKETPFTKVKEIQVN